MRKKTQPNTPRLRNPKLVRVELETLLRRRAEHFCVLKAITELLPRSSDTNGRARGTLAVTELTAHAGVSGKAVARAMEQWRRWRVLWLFWKGSRIWDIRFERQVVEDILATRATEPDKVGPLLLAHKARREAAAPWLRVPKAIEVSTPQAIESVAGAG